MPLDHRTFSSVHGAPPPQTPQLIDPKYGGDIELAVGDRVKMTQNNRWKKVDCFGEIVQLGVENVSYYLIKQEDGSRRCSGLNGLWKSRIEDMTFVSRPTSAPAVKKFNRQKETDRFLNNKREEELILSPSMSRTFDSWIVDDSFNAAQAVQNFQNARQQELIRRAEQQIQPITVTGSPAPSWRGIPIDLNVDLNVDVNGESAF